MSSSIFFRCRSCNARIKAPIQLRGQTRSCPGCGFRIIVRQSPPQDEGPILVSNDQPTFRSTLAGR